MSDTINDRAVPGRVTEYLASGGLWNPELADHDAVRHLLIDARDVIEIYRRDLTAAQAEIADLKAAGKILHERIAEQNAEIARLERDAARYRWLRYRVCSEEMPMLIGVKLDAAIDAAIETERSK